MYDSFIFKQIRKVNRNLFLLFLFFSAASIFLLYLNFGEFKAYISGPKHIDMSAISSLKIDDTTHNYVMITAEKEAKTGIRYVEKTYDKYSKKETSSTVKKEYYILKAGDSYILAALPPDKVGNLTYTGWLRETTSEEDSNLASIIQKFKKANQPIQENCILDAEQSADSLYIYVVFVPLLLVSIFFIIRSIMLTIAPEKHKIYRKLEKLGDADKILREIEEEAASSSFVRMRNISFMNSWILINNVFTLKLIHVDDIVWAYKKVTKHSVNFIPTGKSYQLILCLADKSQAVVASKDANVDFILSSFMQRCPWIIVGYSADIKRMWQKQRAELINHVADKRNNSLPS